MAVKRIRSVIMAGLALSALAASLAFLAPASAAPAYPPGHTHPAAASALWLPMQGLAHITFASCYNSTYKCTAVGWVTEPRYTTAHGYSTAGSGAGVHISYTADCTKYGQWKVTSGASSWFTPFSLFVHKGWRRPYGCEVRATFRVAVGAAYGRLKSWVP